MDATVQEVMCCFDYGQAEVWREKVAIQSSHSVIPHRDH